MSANQRIFTVRTMFPKILILKRDNVNNTRALTDARAHLNLGLDPLDWRAPGTISNTNVNVNVDARRYAGTMTHCPRRRYFGVRRRPERGKCLSYPGQQRVRNMPRQASANAVEHEP